MLKSLAIFIFIFNFIISQNKNPIFLIHGFMGWGRDEVKGDYYWGGKFDLEQYLKEHGYEVFTRFFGKWGNSLTLSCTVAYPRGCNSATLRKLVGLKPYKTFFFPFIIVSRNC